MPAYNYPGLTEGIDVENGMKILKSILDHQFQAPQRYDKNFEVTAVWAVQAVLQILILAESSNLENDRLKLAMEFVAVIATIRSGRLEHVKYHNNLATLSFRYNNRCGFHVFSDKLWDDKLASSPISNGICSGDCGVRGRIISIYGPVTPPVRLSSEAEDVAHGQEDAAGYSSSLTTENAQSIAESTFEVEVFALPPPSSSLDEPVACNSYTAVPGHHRDVFGSFSARSDRRM